MKPTDHRKREAFSLIELLVVMGIVALLMAVTIPALDYATRGGALTRTGALIESVLAQARQEAASRNRDVEVRVLQWEQPSEGTVWGLQSFRVEPDVGGDQFVPVGRLTRLPSNIQVVESEGGASYSPLLTDAKPELTGSMLIPGGVTAGYRAFRLRPDGRLAPLPPTPFHEHNFLTIGLKNRPASENYYTIAINPITGQIQSFRP